MKINYYINGNFVGYSERKVQCGDFCEYCGDCLNCHCEDECYYNAGRGGHSDYCEQYISQQEFDEIKLKENIVYEKN